MCDQSLLALQDSTKTHVLLVHPTAASVPLMWKSLSQQAFATHSLGYIRDAENHVRAALGLSGDGPKVVFWDKGASDPNKGMSVYDGQSLSPTYLLAQAS